MFEISLVVLAIGSIPDNKIFIVFAEHESVKIEAWLFFLFRGV